MLTCNELVVSLPSGILFTTIQHEVVSFSTRRTPYTGEHMRRSESVIETGSRLVHARNFQWRGFVIDISCLDTMIYLCDVSSYLGE